MTDELAQHNDFFDDEAENEHSAEPDHGDYGPRNDAPLDSWMIALARQEADVALTAIPRDLMWARVKQQRVRAARAGPRAPDAPLTPHVVSLSSQTARTRPAPWTLRVAGLAAILVGGIGIGRFLLPASGASKYQLASAASVARADSIAALGLGPDALAALPRSSEPARVAMDEHLSRTVALLVAVRNDNPSVQPSADIGGWARDLLGTTRLLLDEPQLGDQRTRRLLQDLELVLAQIIQVRQSAPETARAPGETMRETNLLPRMRAAVSASRFGEDLTPGGGL